MTCDTSSTEIRGLGSRLFGICCVLLLIVRSKSLLASAILKILNIDTSVKNE